MFCNIEDRGEVRERNREEDRGEQWNEINCAVFLSLCSTVIIEATEVGFGEYRVDFMVKVNQYPGLFADGIIQFHNPPEFAVTGEQVLGENIDIFFQGCC